LENTPLGTGTLYVQDPTNEDVLRKEGRNFNCTETSEAEIIQYVAIHAHSQWTTRHNENPDRVLSSIHAGPGQQVFGSSRNQRCDLLLSFHRSIGKNSTGDVLRPALLFYHNYHGARFHYQGHSPVCPRSRSRGQQGVSEDQFLMLKETEEFDRFRREYAVAMTMVRPSECVFQYSASLECDYYHGSVVHYRSPEKLSTPSSNFEEGVGRIPVQTSPSAVIQKIIETRKQKSRLSSSSPPSPSSTSTPSLLLSSSLSAEIQHQHREAEDPAQKENSSQHQQQQQQQPQPQQTPQQQQQLQQQNMFSSAVEENPQFVGTVGLLLKTVFKNKQNIFSRQYDTHITIADFLAGMKSGKYEGFVTLKGGFERDSHDANDYFGFCIQKYAPDPKLGEISNFTRQQIADYMGWDLNSSVGTEYVDRYLSKQPARTLNSGTFHSEETISTSYLVWLMKERNFSDFTVTHFLRYKFSNQSKAFLEPLLQARHECKQKGQKVEAECLKLIGNGCFGFNGLEASNYDETRLVTGERLKAIRAKSMAHLSLKHITMIGVVKMKTTDKKKKKVSERTQADVPSQFTFTIDEAAESDDEDGDEETGGVSTEHDEDYAEYEKHEKNAKNKRGMKTRKRGKSRDEFCDDNSDFDDLKDLDYSSGDDDSNSSNSSSCNENDDNVDANDQNLSLDEIAIRETEKRLQETELVADHDYLMDPPQSCSLQIGKMKETVRQLKIIKKDKLYKYQFLFAVTVSGITKKIKNCLPRAVAILSNSKKLFLSHIHVMLECLDPKLVEICYIDTDSVIFSSTHQNLADCVLPNKQDIWTFENVIANEAGLLSCHGKMKCEGVFAAGKFRALKVYRLYKTSTDAHQANESNQQVEAVYTRNKGINRWLASQLSDEAFDAHYLEKVTVHRNALRPTRTGEILLVHEARSMTTPFNLKRFVDVKSNGLHTFPLSYGLPAFDQDEADNILNNMREVPM
jgi:hypothetical protein